MVSQVEKDYGDKRVNVQETKPDADYGLKKDKGIIRERREQVGLGKDRGKKKKSNIYEKNLYRFVIAELVKNKKLILEEGNGRKREEGQGNRKVGAQDKKLVQ